MAGWIELALLRHSLTRRVGTVSAPVSYTARLWASALVAGAIGRGAYLALPPLHPVLTGAIILPIFAAIYLGATRAAGIPLLARTG